MRRILAFAVMLLFAEDVWGQVQYTLTDLGTLGGRESVARGINNSGQVVGYSIISGNTAEHAFLYSSGKMMDLGTLGGNDSYAYGINNLGQVVGRGFDSTYMSHAFRTAANQPINPTTDDLSAIAGDNGEAAGLSVNDSGQVVGYSMTGYTAFPNTVSIAYRYDNGAMTNLGTLGGINSWANAINDIGQVAGDAQIGEISGGYQTHAFRTAPNQPINPATDDLGTFGGLGSFAYGINNAGQVVGYADIRGSADLHAFLHSGSGCLNPLTDDLGTLGGSFSEALAINNEGLVVGDSSTASDAGHAFVYGGGKMQDLNDLIVADSGWTLVEATGVNDSGQIVGYGTIDGNTRAFLLTPVPEPSTLFLLGVGAVCLVGHRAVRRWSSARALSRSDGRRPNAG